MAIHLHKRQEKVVGFTLLELLIVIGIMVILGTILILVLNPAETIKRSRDNQRISDLQTLKTAIGLYISEAASPDLDTDIANHCLGGTNTGALVSYSKVVAEPITCSANITEGSDVDSVNTRFSTTDFCRYVSATASAVGAINGTGWVPVNFTTIIGGSPISALPLDPINTVTVDAAPISSDLVYRYACANAQTTAGKPDYVFELDAVLESSTYTSSDNKMSKDSGDNDSYYEVGTSLNLLGNSLNY